MKVSFAVLCFLATCFAQTTHRPHTHTHEPNEGESFQFAYNGHSHDLIVKHRLPHSVLKCYIATVTDDERHMVHSDAGMRSLELRVLGLLTSATEVDADTVDAVNLRYCGHAPHNGTITYYTVP